MASKTLHVRSMTIRYSSMRRFAVIALRETAVETDRGTFVPFISIVKRSDNIRTARVAASNFGRCEGSFAVVIDTTVDREV